MDPTVHEPSIEWFEDSGMELGSWVVGADWESETGMCWASRVSRSLTKRKELATKGSSLTRDHWPVHATAWFSSKRDGRNHSRFRPSPSRRGLSPSTESVGSDLFDIHPAFGRMRNLPFFQVLSAIEQPGTVNRVLYTWSLRC